MVQDFDKTGLSMRTDPVFDEDVPVPDHVFDGIITGLQKYFFK